MPSLLVTLQDTDLEVARQGGQCFKELSKVLTAVCHGLMRIGNLCYSYISCITHTSMCGCWSLLADHKMINWLFVYRYVLSAVCWVQFPNVSLFTSPTMRDKEAGIRQ